MTEETKDKMYDVIIIVFLLVFGGFLHFILTIT